MILIVEDEEALREVIPLMLKNLGYQTKTAANGDEALLAIEKEGLRPDLVINDVIIPGMNGKILAERLLQTMPQLKVLYTSGYTDNAIVHDGTLDSGTPFLQKPYEISELALKIQEILTSQ